MARCWLFHDWLTLPWRRTNGLRLPQQRICERCGRREELASDREGTFWRRIA